MLTAEQHEQRSKGIGSSDVAAILGISPWKTPFHLYLEKVGELKPDMSGNRFTRWGEKLERLILEEVAEDRGLIIAHQHDQPPVSHPRHAWALASPDGLGIVDYDGEPGIASSATAHPDCLMYDCLVEAKTADARKSREWTDEDVPAHYLAQVQWQQEVLGIDDAILAVLIGGNDFRIYDVERDRELGALLLEQAAEFWDRVQRRDPPEPDGAKTTTEALNRLYAQADPSKVAHVEPEAVDLVTEYWRAHEALKAAEERKGEAANRLRMLMGDAEVAVCDGQKVATWKAGTTRRLDVKRAQAALPELAAFTPETVTRTLRPSQALKGE